MSTILVQSLYRLYNNYDPKRVTKEKLHQMAEEGKITAKNYEYITGEEYE